MRDNRLAATLIEQGRDVVLLPLYTPIRTDETAVSDRPIYYGGISVYLRQKSAFFRRLPPLVERLLSAPGLLRLATRWAAKTNPQELGALTVSVLQGPEGFQRAELETLIGALKVIQPSVVHLPDLMFVGIAHALKAALRVSIVCSLAGEDIFLDALPEPFRGQAFELVRRGALDVDRFAAPTKYFTDHATRHFGLPSERVEYVPMGIHVDDFKAANPPERPFTIGYLARICPEKGLAKLCEALIALRKSGRDCRLQAAGYLGAGDGPYLQEIRKTLREGACDGAFEYLGEVTRAQKVAFLQKVHVLSVPTVYREAKGLYILEALAAGVPVVQPRHGSFPELIESTGGGLLYDPSDPTGLEKSLAHLMDDPGLRRDSSQRVFTGRASFTDTIMAEATWSLYERLIG